jgi:hypothetical protein
MTDTIETMESLYDRFKMECELADLKYISSLKCNIDSTKRHYALYMQAKDYDSADLMDKMVELLKQDLRWCENELVTPDSGGQVSSAQPGGSKTVFILKK